MKQNEVVVVIVAGGVGTRMREILGDLPKFLAPITGESCFADVMVERLAALGTNRVHLCLGIGAEDIDRWCSSRELPVAVTSTVESKPRGVIGAVRDAAHRLPERFVLAYGDVWPPLPPESLLRPLQTPMCAAMAVCPAEICGQLRPNTEVREGRVVRYSKDSAAHGLSHLDAGMVGLSKRALNDDSQCNDEVELFPTLIERGVMAAIPSDRAPLQVGDPPGYVKARAVLASEVRA